MTLKFLYITTDPFVNQSEDFVRILDIWIMDQATIGGSSSGINVSTNGALVDPSGNTVCHFFVSQTVWSYQTEATAYPVPYGGSSNIWTQRILIVPPSWKFENFGLALAVQGTLEEVLRVH
ncbi:MAG: hypothetical protein QW429_05620 [Thermoprotei archaeon]